MSKSVDFYFDFGSPASYLAWTQLPQLSAETGAQVQFKPMLLGAVFQATGNSSPIAVPAKGRYTFMDFSHFAKRYGVVLKMNPHFPINTLTLMRMASGVQQQLPEQFDALLRAVFEGIWVHSLNLGDPQVLAQTLSNAGLDPAALLALANDAHVKEQLKQTTNEAVAKGVFGAPSFIVDGELFFGQDRLDFVREALAR